MKRTAVAISIAFLVVGLSGCGVGLGSGPSSGEVEVSVTRDYGRDQVAGPTDLPLRPSDSVMDLLDQTVDLRTGYGGRFVEAIDGIESSTSRGNADWFYFVNGIEAEVGAASFRPGRGDRVWWDFRDWTETMYVGAVIGSYPAPLRGGFDGRWDSPLFSCLAEPGICRSVRSELEADGIVFSREPGEENAAVVVGSIVELERSSRDQGIGEGPGTSGVFARLRGSRTGSGLLEALDERGEVVRRFGAGAGLVAAVRAQGRAPVWLITGTDDDGVVRASAALDAALLRDTYAVVMPPGNADPLPVPVKRSGTGR